MQLSAELRWFWEGQCPDDVSGWFSGPQWAAASITEQYTDHYFLMPGNTEIACKLRNPSSSDSGYGDTKALITRLERNRMEIWGKWKWLVPTQATRVIVQKERQLRHFSSYGASYAYRDAEPMDERPGAKDASTQSSDICRIELTRVQVDGLDGTWWTFGLEAWGGMVSAPLMLARTLDRLNPPMAGERLLNYPQFLTDLLSERG